MRMGVERVIQKRRGNQHKDSLLWDLSEENSFQFVCSEESWEFIHQLKIEFLVINSSEHVGDPKGQEKTQGWT